jgi:hypothetical protein
VNDDWRVQVELDDEAHGHPLAERLRALDLDDDARKRLGGDVIVTRDGTRIYLYAADEQAAREAERAEPAPAASAPAARPRGRQEVARRARRCRRRPRAC